MVFDPSSLEQAVSDAFGPSKSAAGDDGRASAEISDDFFDAPDDSSGLGSMPAAFLEPSEDGLATRQLDTGNLERARPSHQISLTLISMSWINRRWCYHHERQNLRATNPTPTAQRQRSCRLEIRRVDWMR